MTLKNKYFTFGDTLGRKGESVRACMGRRAGGSQGVASLLPPLGFPDFFLPLTCLQAPSTVLKHLSSPIQRPFSIPTLDLQKNQLPFPQAQKRCSRRASQPMAAEVEVSGHSQTLLRYNDDSVARRGKTTLS